jgi:hypothetical protein
VPANKLLSTCYQPHRHETLKFSSFAAGAIRFDSMLSSLGRAAPI